ncbi:MAG: RHS repeat protein [Betaproteobacteria bacterium]|nr:RHS repeat protein [Betaproteobacteria bacterium]
MATEPRSCCCTKCCHRRLGERARLGFPNALNRLAQDLGAQGQPTSYGYDGNANLTSTTDPLASTTTNTYDALNRLTHEK